MSSTNFDNFSQANAVSLSRHGIEHDWKNKCIIYGFVISQQIKEVTANGHEKLNRLMIAQTP